MNGFKPNADKPWSGLGLKAAPSRSNGAPDARASRNHGNQSLFSSRLPFSELSRSSGSSLCECGAYETRLRPTTQDRCEERERTMALTKKEHEKRLDEMSWRLDRKVRGMFEQPSIASRLYPKLKTEDERRRQEKQQKEK